MANKVLGFAGVGAGNYGFTVNSTPPDTNMAVGLSQVVQWVNTSFAIFDKTTGAKLYPTNAGAAGINTLFTGFGGACETRNDGDPIVQYDQLADRWVIGGFALTGLCMAADYGLGLGFPARVVLLLTLCLIMLWQLRTQLVPVLAYLKNR